MNREWWIGRAVEVYRFSLQLYSKRFREEYGPEMLALFRARLERVDRKRRWELLREAIAGIGDAVGGAILERRQARARKVRAPRRPRDSGASRAFGSLRIALRSLLRQPAFVLPVVLTLSLGCGATIALFAVADGALLRPLPYPNSERLVSIVQTDPKFGMVPFAPPYLADLRERTTSFDAIAGFSPSWALKLVGLGDPRVVTAAFVSDELFDLIGVRPLEGRSFTTSDHARGAPAVALVTRTFWARHFGASAPFSERSLRLDGSVYSVVGILPDTVRLPITTSAVSRRGDPAEVFLPFVANPYAETRAVPVMNVVAGLREGVSLPVAAIELDSLTQSLGADFPETSRLPVTGILLGDLVTRGSKRTVWMLFGAASFLLLIACANVANLLLARAADRRTEIAIRASLGAGRRRVIAGLLVESLLLSLLGTTGGLVLAWWLLELVPSLGLGELPPSATVGIDPRVALFAIVLATTTTLVFGLAPALHASRSAEAGVLRSARATGGAGRARSALVGAEIALALFLLIGAGLLARSYWNLLRVDPGFRAEGLLVVPLDLSSDTYGAPERRTFVTELRRRLETLPRVSSVGAVNRLPLSGSNVFVGVEVEGLDPSFDREPVVDRRVVSPGYWATMGIPILEGRDFGPGDRSESTPVAVVNETLARRFWPEGALGRRARLQLRGGPGPWLTVVGVAGDVLHHGLAAAPEPELYVPYEQAPVESFVAVVRTSADPLTLAPTARETVWAMDPSMPLDGIDTVSHVVHDSAAEPRYRMLVLNGFGALALLLAAIGVYGVTAYTVASRTREIGLRIALGAEGTNVLRLVVGRGVRLALWGVGLGLGGALLLSRLLEGLLFGVTPTDAGTFVLVSCLLLAVAALASYVPARRATRVDPVEVLRFE